MTMEGQFPAVIQLSSVNGANGFELGGAAVNDESGYSVSIAGDINGDGIQDIIIGAPDASPGGLIVAGKTYVVFGNDNWSSPISLSTLNGANGFALDGETANDQSGYSVSTAGDVNDDGIQDIIIGAPDASPIGSLYGGKSYVIFGKTNWTSPFLLSSLNGINGFQLDGVAYEQNGVSVSTAGDVNGDGIQDIIVGAFEAAGGAGAAYVVFGRSNWTSPIALSSLNGINGIRLAGGMVGDQCGASVSQAGDVNGDGIQDLLVGAYQASPGGLNLAGKTYVVFGKNLWTSSIALSSLNGTNGFELEGVIANDLSGSSVKTAGDVNGDGIHDIIIGAYNASFGGLVQAGRAYVVFGKRIWTSPISFSNLNGSNGFELDGLATGDNTGVSVSSAGDFNLDGIQDIIIGASGSSPGGKTQAGKTYMVFGKTTWTSPITLSSLNGIDGFQLIGANANDYSGHSVSSAGDVNNDGIGDIIIGAWYAISAGLSAAGKSYVVFGDSPPVLVNNQLSILQGQRVTLNANILSAFDLNHANNTLLFTPDNITAGQFEVLGDPGVPISNFTQQQITNGTIQFVHDGSGIEPSYNIKVSASGFAFVGPTAANVSFSLAPTAAPSTSPTSSFPLLIQNSLFLSNGEVVTLTLANLQAIESNFNISQLIFTVNNVQQGNFYRMPANVTAYTFPQSYVQQGRILFRHAGTNIAPAYSVIVSDGTQSTLPVAATINFQGAPTVQINPLNITQSQAIVLDTQTIIVTTALPPAQVQLQISNLQHATITSIASGLPVSSFTLAQLQSGDIQLQQDGSPNAPSFTITASVPPGISSSPITPSITFSAQGILAPQLINNYLIIAEGETVTLAPLEMYALQGNNPLPDTATYYVNNIQYGYFTLSTTPNVHVSFFTQGQLKQGLVQFTQDGSSNIPNYQLSVSSDGLQSASLPAGVFFSPITRPPRLIQPFPDQTVTVGKPFSFAIINNFIDPQGESVALTPQGVNRTMLPQWLSYNPTNQRFSGIAPNPGITDVEIVGTNVDELSAQSDFIINATPNTTTSLSYLQKTIISAAVSGGVGLSFYLLKLALKRAADRKLLDSLKQNKDDFDVNVVRPIAEAISKRVKITGFSGISENTLDEFKGAVRTLIAELESRGVEIHLEKLEPSKRDALINEIATQTKLYLKDKRSYGKALCSFLTAEASPEDIRKAAPAIAEQIVSVIEARQGANVVMRGLVLEEQKPKKVVGAHTGSASYVEMEDMSDAEAMEIPESEEASSKKSRKNSSRKDS